jgi:tetratricopeptide (TPR) repeat protein
VKCVKCGHENPRDTRFCEECGAQFDVASAPSTSYGWVVALVVIALLAGLTAILYQQFRTQEKSVDISQPGLPTTPKPQAPRPTLISGDLPIATIEGFAPLTVKLQPVSFEQPTEPGALSYVWEFAPGRREFYRETGGRAVFTYTKPGLYNAKLTVSDESGDIARQVWEVVVFSDEARNTPGLFQSDPKSVQANLAMANLYFDIGANNPGIYYAMRAYLANPEDTAAVSKLVEGFERMPRFGEYQYYVLAKGAALTNGKEFITTLDENKKVWLDNLEKRKNELANSAGQPSRATISNYLLALVSIGKYEDAFNYVTEKHIVEEQLDNMAWYALNLGKNKEALEYASRWLVDHPKDPYGLEYMMIVSALSGDYTKAREYLSEYIETNPARGHVVSVVMDLVIFTEKGISKEFVWESVDALRVFL